MNYFHGYSTIKMIGSGGSGKVFLVRKNNKNFAIKKIPFNNLEEKANIKKEIDILSSLNDDHIVKYYESFSDNESYYIVMDYYECSLRDMINKFKKKNINI
jgi:serine/threonine protein kinase